MRAISIRRRGSRSTSSSPIPRRAPGPVYDPDQPPYLRMNFAADQLDMWWPASGAAPRPLRRSFVEWRAARDGDDEAYPPRAEVGEYLCEGLETILRHAPPNVEVRLHRARVDAVRAGRRRLARARRRGRRHLRRGADRRRPSARLPHRARGGLDARRSAHPGRVPRRPPARARTRRTRGDGGGARLRTHVHRCGAGPDGRPRRLVRAPRPPLPPALRPRRRRRPRPRAVHAHRPADAREAGPGARRAHPRARAHRGRGTRPAFRPARARSTCAATSSRS